MELKIYTSKGAVRHTTDTTRKESTRVQQLMNDNYVQIVFNHTEELGFKAGDNIVYKGEKFSIIQDYKAEVVNECEYHYELKFEGSEGYFKTLPFFHYITNGEQTEKEPEVNYTATLAMTAEMAITSLRKASGDDTWKVGALAEGDESKYLNFSADSIFDAFGKIADEFNTEWWIKGKTINFSRCERGDLQTFSAKAGGGLSSVEIASSNEIIPNRIHAYGSTRNITKKYTAQGLAYNTRLRLPAGIEYVDLTGGAENVISKTVFFDNDEVGDIYPRRIGTITALLSPTSESGDKTYYFYDKNLDFDPYEQLIKGSTMMVHFESGMLQGRDFEVAYDKDNKRFGILSSQEGEVQIPFGSIVPKVGDKYILWNMQMPESYITNAEQELLTVAQKYIDDINKKTPEITCKSFEPYFDEYGKVVTVGSRIKIEDDRLKGGYIQSRVTKYSYPLFCETQVEFTLSENVASGRLTQIENKVEDVTADNAQNVQSTRAVSRRAWRDAQELTTALEALQVELVLVGNPESQFSCSCVFKSNKNNDPNLLAISAGELQHVVYKGDAGDKWAIEGAEFTLIADTLYYIYFKCSKSTNKGNVIISQTRQEIESQEEYYLFLGGVVSSIFENTRIVNIVSGFTQIAGGNITTERIQDPTGKLIIDLTSNPPRIIARGGAKLIGAFTFESAQGLENIEGIDDIKSNISTAQGSANDAQTTANEASRATQAVNDYVQALESDVNAELVAVNKRLDGVIENYFELYDPTLNNYPANEWTTEKLKEDHNGDTFTNKSTGDSWKWKIIGGVWVWNEITDVFEKELLSKIAKAQETADGKIRNFVFEPYPPYTIGDTWTQGPAGDLMRCVKSRASGVFAASDWDKASKYTDDAVANEAAQAAKAAQTTATATEAVLADMANDLKFTPQEKVDQRDVYAQMALDYQSYQNNATSYGVPLAAVTKAYDNLRSYLIKVAKINDQTTTTTITAAQGTTYDQCRSAWKTSVDAFANDISKKFVDNVQVSTVNLANGTESFTITSDAAQPYQFKRFPIGEVRKGEDFSISFGAIRVLAGLPTKFTCIIYNKTNNVALSGFFDASLDRMFGVLKISGETQDANLLVYAGPAGATNGNSVQFEKLMIVRGNRPALTWTESPEDMQAKVDKAQTAADNLGYLGKVFEGGKTDVDGGVLLSNFMGVKNAGGAVAAGMAGKNFLTGSPIFPMLFAGATGAQQANDAKFRVYANGDVHMKALVAENGCKLGDFTLVDGFLGGDRMEGAVTYRIRVSTYRFDFSVFGGGRSNLVAIGGGTPTLIDGTIASMRVNGGVFFDAGYGDGTGDGVVMQLDNGYIAGLRQRGRATTIATTLTNIDNTLVCNNASRIRITLPTTPYVGQKYTLYVTKGEVEVYSANKLINFLSIGENLSSYVFSSWKGIITLEYVKGYAQWLMVSNKSN